MRNEGEDTKIACEIAKRDRAGNRGHGMELRSRDFRRLYYWYQGTMADRPGGPWWYKDFPIEKDLIQFLEKFKPFFYCYVKTFGDEEVSWDWITPPGRRVPNSHFFEYWILDKGIDGIPEGVWRKMRAGDTVGY